MSLRIANPFAGLEAIVAENYPLKRHAWYRIGGPARYFIRPRSQEELAEAIARCVENAIPIFILGLGANLLIRDEGIDGAVFRLDDPAFGSVEIEGDIITAGAGVDLQKLIVRTVREGLSGLETLAGIPGTVGGAIRMNAGGKFGDIGAVVESVTTMDYGGAVARREKNEIVFGYRSSNLVDPIILTAQFRLETENADELVKRCKEVWMYKRNTQPLNTRNSGCIFKNPGNGVSAGALIDQSGLKGMRVGQAEVSTKHANFVIAYPDCPSGDVLKLIKLVQDRVYDQHQIALETEVKIWPTA
jgi:UDP-N-acetylmuramate dehydrogenase